MAAYELTVSVRTQYLEDQSDPDRSKYVFAYAVTIKNSGQAAAQVISRLWTITDDADLGRSADGHLPLSKSVPEWLSPLTTILPGQLLALALVQAKGLDPDRPRGLPEKVVRTT